MAQGPQFNNLGPRIALAAGFQTRGLDGTFGPGLYYGTTFPKSGTAGSTVKNGTGAYPGSFYCDTTNDVWFVNEGTAVSPYWTPVSFSQNGLLGYHTDFTSGAGPEQTGVVTLGYAIANTTAGGQVLTNGFRVNGQGIEQTDSGLTIANTATDGGGPVASLIATDEDAHLTQLSVGNGTTATWQPDQHGTMVIDCKLTNSSARTLRNIFVGWHGDGTGALDPIMTYATTVITSVGTDIAGLAYSAELTDADSIFNVNFDAAGGATLTTTAVDTGVDMAAAGTYQRFRVEVDSTGVVRTFIDKALVGTSAAAAADVDEEFIPSVIIESTSAATKTILLRHMSVWGKKVL